MNVKLFVSYLSIHLNTFITRFSFLEISSIATIVLLALIFILYNRKLSVHKDYEPISNGNFGLQSSLIIDGLSQDIKIPLMRILKPLSTLCDSDDISGRNKSVLMSVRSSCQDALDKVNHLNLNSRGDNIKVSNINLFQFSRSVIKKFETLANSKNINLRFTCLSGEHLVLCLYESYYESILSNILFNAIKYTKDGGVVSVIIKDNKSNITISVEDSGIGIPSEDFRLIFEKNRKASNANTSGISGDGMGVLYLSK